ncbi:uncharacterized protein LOC112455901 [Temnothorax curvispinosus]|uniref:Uncharacterized protein LOC112455901 n=1 Tax=Temnothorax curvispinosus TaxID=300111 RepID=A0A6J1PVH8_9HYME|nr:uncharacterized protein LOC112455901 [Temnothorax curvispinosus]
MSSELSARHVQFDGTNFLGWKFQVTQIFLANDVLDVVNGDRVEPHDRTSAEGKAWVKDNAKAMFFISSSMEYSQLEPLLTCADVNTKVPRVSHMGPTDTVVQHVARVQNMATQLMDLGENLSDVTIMAKVLASLTAKFLAFHTAWDSVEPARQTIENLQERLLREESRLSADAGEVTVFAAVKVTKTSTSEDSKTKRKKKKKEKKDIECFICLDFNFITSNYFKAKDIIQQC